MDAGDAATQTSVSGMILAAGTLVTGETVLTDGWLVIDGGRVSAVGSGAPPRPADVDLGDQIVVPGFVDLHVHGGGGGAYDADNAVTGVDFHREHGTTTTLASVVTASPAHLLTAVARLADLTEQGAVAGIHLEGPWLSEHRPGAHQVSELRDPDRDELAAVLAAGRGAIRMITFAPERPGALEAIRVAVDHGVVAAIGHTNASYATARAGIEAGATVATHLFNAMTPIHHREPGPIIALLEDSRVTVEVILDGIHLHPVIYGHVVAAAGSDRVALVTDAIAAAGLADGDYVLGELKVTVTDGVSKLADQDTIAGGTATTDRLFGNAVRFSGWARPDALLAAARQTSTNPARVLGLTDRTLEPGGAADLVVLDADLNSTAVMQRGDWIVRAEN